MGKLDRDQMGPGALGTHWCPAAEARCIPRPLTQVRGTCQVRGKSIYNPAPQVLFLTRVVVCEDDVYFLLLPFAVNLL